MALAINDFGDEGGRRDRLSRTLGVAATLYGLMAAITAALAIAGGLGLAGLAVDPSAGEAARVLALPWSLAAGGGGTVYVLALTLGGLAANLLLLLAGARLARGPRRGRA